MTIEDQIKNENYNMTIQRLQYYNRETINREYQLYHQVNLINMTTLLVKKYYHRTNNELLNKLNLLILLWEKLLKNKQKQLKIKEKNK